MIIGVAGACSNRSFPIWERELDEFASIGWEPAKGNYYSDR
jgi:hypothetical protein